jgi:hypothetical protein
VLLELVTTLNPEHGVDMDTIDNAKMIVREFFEATKELDAKGEPFILTREFIKARTLLDRSVVQEIYNEFHKKETV